MARPLLPSRISPVEYAPVLARQPWATIESLTLNVAPQTLMLKFREPVLADHYLTLFRSHLLMDEIPQGLQEELTDCGQAACMFFKNLFGENPTLPISRRSTVFFLPLEDGGQLIIDLSRARHPLLEKDGGLLVTDRSLIELDWMYGEADLSSPVGSFKRANPTAKGGDTGRTLFRPPVVVNSIGTRPWVAEGGFPPNQMPLKGQQLADSAAMVAAASKGFTDEENIDRIRNMHSAPHVRVFLPSDQEIKRHVGMFRVLGGFTSPMVVEPAPTVPVEKSPKFGGPGPDELPADYPARSVKKVRGPFTEEEKTAMIALVIQMRNDAIKTAGPSTADRHILKSFGYEEKT